MDVQAFLEASKPIVVAFALKVLGALAIYVVGRWLIGVATRLVASALERKAIDATVGRYLVSVIAIALNVLLVIGILGYFGVETTSFAALIAALGIAIGAAWGGLLSNFAAGVFILVLRPFKVGDYVDAAEVEGTVRSIGLFSTAIDTPDNVRTFVGNAKVMGGALRNYSANAYRRVDLTAQVGHGVDPLDAIRRLKPALAGIANVMTTPAPDVEILAFNERGTQLAVRPYAHTNHYWQVYFETNKVIRQSFASAGYPVPEEHTAERQV